jgi:hypothetical protein
MRWRLRDGGVRLRSRYVLRGIGESIRREREEEGVRLRFDVLLTVEGKKRERERFGERAYGTTELSNHHDTRCSERYP